MRVLLAQTLLLAALVGVGAWPEHPPTACDAVIEREVRQSGNRRELVTSVSLSEDHFRMCIIQSDRTKWYDRLVCNVNIREELPPSLYVDPAEMETMSAKYNYRAFANSAIDVYAAAEDSKDLTVSLFIADAWPNPDWIGVPASFDLKVYLPLRVRPQAATEGEIDITIPPPSRVGISCVAPKMLQEWDPVKARELYVEKPPHGVDINPNTKMSFTYAERYMSGYTWRDLGGIPEESVTMRVPVADIERRTPPAAEFGVDATTLGAGGLAIAILVAVWKVSSSPSPSKKKQKPAKGGDQSQKGDAKKAKKGKNSKKQE